MTKGTIVPNPDLSKVDEVGFVDLMPSSGHGQGGWSDVAQIEVYGRPVARCCVTVAKALSAVRRRRSNVSCCSCASWSDCS